LLASVTANHNFMEVNALARAGRWQSGSNRTPKSITYQSAPRTDELAATCNIVHLIERGGHRPWQTDA
jgi:hypothetical protein